MSNKYIISESVKKSLSTPINWELKCGKLQALLSKKDKQIAGYLGHITSLNNEINRLKLELSKK